MLTEIHFLEAKTFFCATIGLMRFKYLDKANLLEYVCHNLLETVEKKSTIVRNGRNCLIYFHEIIATKLYSRLIFWWCLIISHLNLIKLDWLTLTQIHFLKKKNFCYNNRTYVILCENLVWKHKASMICLMLFVPFPSSLHWFFSQNVVTR